MTRVRDYLALIDDPEHAALAADPSADAPLFSLLAHLAAGDGKVAGDELALVFRKCRRRTLSDHQYFRRHRIARLSAFVHATHAVAAVFAGRARTRHGHRHFH